MRSLRPTKGKAKAKPVNRNGVRAVQSSKLKKAPALNFAPGNIGQGNVAPGRRRNLAADRNFARRATRPANAVMRWLDDVRDAGFGRKTFSVATIGLIVSVVLYGLFVGGHVASAGNQIADRANKLMALAGFSIGEVTLSGRSHADSKALLTALGIKRGDPIFGFDTEVARQNIEHVDWVKSATVTRLLPDAIRIDIVERKPFAIWQRGGELSVVDGDGHIITDNNVQAYATLPFIVGFGGAREAEDILQLMHEAQPEFLARVRAFVRVGDRRWNLRLENGVDIKLPEVGVEKALADIVAMDAQYKILSRDIESVDLRLPDRVSVALTPEAVAGRNEDMAEKVSLSGGAKARRTTPNLNGATGPVKAGTVRVGGNT